MDRRSFIKCTETYRRKILKTIEREYEKLSKEVKPKLKRPLINRLLNRPVIAIPAPRQKVDKLNLTVIMVSKLETEIALLKSSTSIWNPYKELEQLEKIQLNIRQLSKNWRRISKGLRIIEDERIDMMDYKENSYWKYYIGNTLCT